MFQERIVILNSGRITSPPSHQALLLKNKGFRHLLWIHKITGETKPWPFPFHMMITFLFITLPVIANHQNHLGTDIPSSNSTNTTRKTHIRKHTKTWNIYKSCHNQSCILSSSSSSMINAESVFPTNFSSILKDNENRRFN